MNYYKNQLCEINEGFYSLNKTGRSCGHHVAFKFKEIDLPEKIYTKYNDFKIKYKNIEDIKLKEIFSNSPLFKRFICAFVTFPKIL